MRQNNIKMGMGIVITLIILLALLSTTASAAEPVGTDFAGNVYRDGANAPVGVEVRAEVDGVIYGRTGTSNPGTGTTTYLMGTEGDDPATPPKDGCVNGEIIVFFVEDMVCDEFFDDWQPGLEILPGVFIPYPVVLDLHYSTAGQPGLLKINEIMPNPENGNEWIELYNPTGANVDLGTYSLWKNDGSLPGTKLMDLAGTIQASDWYVVDLGVNPVLNDAGHDEIKLVWTDSGGVKAGGHPVVIDRVEFGSASTGPDDTTNSNVEMGNAQMPSMNVTIELEPDGDDTNHPDADFTLSSRPSSTQGYTNTQVQPLITLENPPTGTSQADFNYLITWSDDDPDDNATIKLYYDIDDEPGNEVFICTVPQGEDSAQDSYLWDTSLIVIGNYYIKAEIYDGITPMYYDYSEGRIAVVHPPDIYIIEPDGISDWADSSYCIQWVDHDSDDNATISLYYDTDNISGGETLLGTGPMPQGEDPDGGLWDSYIWNTTSVTEGDYYIKASIYDGITAVYNYSAGTVSVRHPPSITLLNPMGISDLADKEYRITWIDQDNDDDALITLYYDDDATGYDGVEIVTDLSEDDTEDTYIWNTSSLPEGSSWYVYAEITDGSTTAYSYSPGLVSITHPPTIHLLEPDGESDVADREYTIRWEDDDTDDNATITLYLDGDSNPGGESLIGEVLQGEDMEGDGDTYLLDTTHVFEGLYFIKAVINDSTNSDYDYSIGQLTIYHNRVPSITVISPAQDVYTNDFYLITWVDVDLDDNATVTLYYDDDLNSGNEILIGVVPQGEDSILDSYIWDITAVVEGSYYIKAEISDGINPIEYDFSSGSIIVDRTAPSPPELDDIDTLRKNSSLIIKGDAEPFVWVDIYRNDVLIGTVITDSEGKFELPLTLNEGRNRIYTKARDETGNTGDQSKTQEVFLDTTSPTAMITYVSSTSMVQWRELMFMGKGIDDNPIVNYEWVSDTDGILGSSSQLTTSSLSKGTHTIHFKVKDAVGLWSEPVTIEIEVAENIAPVLDAGQDIKIKVGEKVFFYPSVLDSDGPMTKFEWDFEGDGSYDWSLTQNGNIYFKYDESGKYHPVIRVTDIDGNTSTDSVTVEVLEEVLEEAQPEEPEEDVEYLNLLWIIIIVLLVIHILIQIMNVKKTRDLISDSSKKIEDDEVMDEEGKTDEELEEEKAPEDDLPPPSTEDTEPVGEDRSPLPSDEGIEPNQDDDLPPPPEDAEPVDEDDLPPPPDDD
ncbi:MAG: lamin tail domain-containing protein [Methanomassiliicoccales archaeon]|nr:MAG: lamin tail domain-containing protein [Methanomassiliicoccales archaeon]